MLSTTSKPPAFYQPLEFAAILPDDEFWEIERINQHCRIGEPRECLAAIVGLNAGEANLAGAGGIATGGFNIQCDEAKISMRDVADMLKVWAGSGDHI